MVRVERSVHKDPHDIPCFRCHKPMREGYNIHSKTPIKDIPPLPNKKRYPRMASSQYYRWLCKWCAVAEGYIW